MSKRLLLLLAAPFALGGCPLATMTDAVNQLAMTPEPGTFRAIDCNGDGAMTQAEASARISLRTKAAPTLHGLTAAEFATGDGDRSGGWSYEEFRAYLTTAEAWSVAPTGCAP